MITRLRTFALMAAALLALRPAVAQQASGSESLPRLKSVFAQKTSEIERAYETARQAADAGYLKDLQAVYQQMKAKNDEFGLRPVITEAKRFQQEKSVLREAPEGTPELLLKASARYFALLDPAVSGRSNQLEKLARSYRRELEALRATAPPDAAAPIAAELERIAPLLGDLSASAPAATRAPLHLPTPFLRGLRLAYALSSPEPHRVEDLSGRAAHGSLSGTMRLETAAEGAVRDFMRESDQVGVPDVRVNRAWTLVVRAQFPLELAGKPRVLMSGGYEKHHVLVDARGELGVQDGTFTGSGSVVSSLRGWHELAAVGSGHSTTFFIDGKPVGTARALCAEPVKALGNGATGGQPWGGSLSAVLLWSDALAARDIAALYQRARTGTAP